MNVGMPRVDAGGVALLGWIARYPRNRTLSEALRSTVAWPTGRPVDETRASASRRRIRPHMARVRYY